MSRIINVIMASCLLPAGACKGAKQPQVLLDGEQAGPDGKTTAADADVALDAVDAGSVPDIAAAPDVPDSASQPDLPLDVADGSEDGVDIPGDATPIDACADGKDLPLPGQTCSKEGEIRCTRVGESTSELPWGLPSCLRPNQVVCSKSAGGALSWTVNPCPQIPTSCTAGNPTTCQENSRGAHCCPAVIMFQNSKIGEALLCDASQEGALTCLPPVPGAGPSGPGGVLQRCTFTDTPAANPEAQTWKTPQGACAPYCKDCLFYLPEDICPMIQHAICSPSGAEESDYKLLQWCLTNIPGTNGPACMKNCDDWKYAPDYGK